MVHALKAPALNLPLAEPVRLPRWMTWGLYAVLWSLPGLAALSYYYLNQTVTGQPLVWRYAVVSTLPNWYFWAALAPVVIWLVRRYPVERSNWKAMLFGLHLPVMVLLLLLHSLANLVLFHLSGMPGHERLTVGLYEVHFTSRFHANVLTYWTVLGIVLAIEYYRKYRLREQQAALLEIRLTQANLRALKMQLHPHFLFNTLNSIAALVRKNENRTAVRMLAKLGEFLRLALENKGVQEIPLKQELDFLERYLEIEKIRFQERLTVQIEAEPAVLEAYVPNMILQPLVENAIHHGIAPHAGAGRIEIHARHEAGRLVMQVRDDGPGLDPNKTGRRGVGLDNTRERLATLYGTDQRFELRNAEAGGLVATIAVPFSTAPTTEGAA